MKMVYTDICVIGAGAGGLSVAAAAVQMGAQVVLIERGKMGGDCLNYGCVPSKSLLASSKVARTFTQSAPFGIASVKPDIDIPGVMSYVQSVVDTIAPHDSVERFEQLGVTVIQAKGECLDKNTVKAGEELVKARYVVIATGSSPAIPPLVGLTNIPYFTNETIFSLTEKPTHLVIIGGGASGCEMAQAFILLGVKVTLLEVAHILPHADQHQVDILRQILIDQGLTLYEQAVISNIVKQDDGMDIVFEHQAQQKTLNASHVLVSTGRRANIEALNLSAAGIQWTEKGITVDQRLRTSNKRVFAIGDVIGGCQFTHIANYHAGIVIRQMLFKLPVQFTRTFGYHCHFGYASLWNSTIGQLSCP